MKQKFFFILFNFLMKSNTFTTIVNNYAKTLVACPSDCKGTFEKPKRKYTKRKK